MGCNLFQTNEKCFGRFTHVCRIQVFGTIGHNCTICTYTRFSQCSPGDVTTSCHMGHMSKTFHKHRVKSCGRFSSMCGVKVSSVIYICSDQRHGTRFLYGPPGHITTLCHVSCNVKQLYKHDFIYTIWGCQQDGPIRIGVTMGPQGFTTITMLGSHVTLPGVAYGVQFFHIVVNGPRQGLHGVPIPNFQNIMYINMGGQRCSHGLSRLLRGYRPRGVCTIFPRTTRFLGVRNESYNGNFSTCGFNGTHYLRVYLLNVSYNRGVMHTTFGANLYHINMVFLRFQINCKGAMSHSCVCGFSSTTFGLFGVCVSLVGTSICSQGGLININKGYQGVRREYQGHGGRRWGGE